ncbi:Gfo/Idh/MocA family oxidoreductase, partial [Candidatus Aerophobetes bacterium]|nr:Gfo/Idh/MocA family oxidoreductase [Candidatus Aerophobetes bacterium]
MPKVVNIGIAGAGRIGQRHAENLLTQIPNTHLVAVADVDKKRAQELAEKCGKIRWYDDYEKMLEQKDIEAVLISASTNVHKEIIIGAAKKGKHIFCEKPIDLTLEETNE